LRIKERLFEFEFELELSTIVYDSQKITRWSTVDYKEIATMKTRDVTALPLTKIPS
jgi:hypothetical protein